MEDARIVELYWERDEAAIAESSAKYGGYCYQIAFRILACGRTRRSAWETPGCGPGSHAAQPPRRLDTFLGKITRNLSLDRWRACGPRSGGRDRRNWR